MAGTKNSGRKSKYQERAAAEIVKSIFNGKYKPHKPDMFAKSLRAGEIKGVLSGWDVVAFKIITGKSEKIIIALVNKLVPDIIDKDGWGEALKNVTQYYLPQPYARDSGPEDTTKDRMAT